MIKLEITDGKVTHASGLIPGQEIHLVVKTPEDVERYRVRKYRIGRVGSESYTREEKEEGNE